MSSAIPKLDVGAELAQWLSNKRYKIPETIRIELKSGTFRSEEEFTKTVLGLDAGNLLGTLEVWGNLGETYGTIDYTAHKKGIPNAVRIQWGIKVWTLNEFEKRLTEFLDDFMLLVSEN